MSNESETPFTWYENYFKDRVLPKICKDMGECAGVFSWLAENDPALSIRIAEAWELINSLWLNRSEKESFKDACKSWYMLLMEAKKGFEVWKVNRLEESRQPAQKAMVLR